MPHFLIAPNAFKHSLTAGDVARAIYEGLQNSGLPCTAECFPIGDGGDGTVELIIQRLNGIRIDAKARDPFGREIKTFFGLVEEAPDQPSRPAPGITALIEMANASGLRLLGNDELDPLHALSTGTGDLIRAALDKKASRIIIGMGGSATVDGGIGILGALGVGFLDKKGEPLTGLPGSLADLAVIDTSGLDPRLADCELIVLCDVDNKLLGPAGSAAIFGPQKGAGPEAVQQLDAGLSRLSEVVLQQKGKDIANITYGGTAGGAAAGLYGILNATLVNGIDHFLDITGFDEALAAASWVITGEGSIDEQTLQGKGPYGVALRAKHAGLPVIALAGKVPLQSSPRLKEYFGILLAIGNEPSGLANAFQTTAANLSRTAAAIGRLLTYSHSPAQPEA